MYNSDLTMREVLGLTAEAPREAWLALRGDPLVPPSRFGPSSLRQLMPRLALATWRGKSVVPRHAIITNLFNHTPTPIEDGWSVRVTRVRDFRGRGLTYDSHNGTDFTVPPGTRAVAAAAGRVVSVRSEYNRGGLKVYLDHGGGLLTTMNHLARAFVRPGDVVERGTVIGLSGYSGIDALASFLAAPPHIHFNVCLNGVLVDPFAPPGGRSLWRTGDPRPFGGARDGDGGARAGSAAPGTRFDPARVAALLAQLEDRRRREAIAAIADPDRRGWELVIESITYPARFSIPHAGATLFEATSFQEVPREEPPSGAGGDNNALDLPFPAADFDGVVFADDVGLRAAPARPAPTA
jgi:murein DD-endopeptidase MepM/ murein hydrolase activator NlpD